MESDSPLHPRLAPLQFNLDPLSLENRRRLTCASFDCPFLRGRTVAASHDVACGMQELIDELDPTSGLKKCSGGQPSDGTITREEQVTREEHGI